jgi:predicted transcriptional regulator
MQGMKIEASIFDEIDGAAEAAADARAEADVAAGRVISHEAMSRWLTSIAEGDPQPSPEVGE